MRVQSIDDPVEVDENTMRAIAAVCSERGYLIISRSAPAAVGDIFDKIGGYEQPLKIVAETDANDCLEQTRLLAKHLGLPVPDKFEIKKDEYGAEVRYHYRTVTD